MIFKKQTFLALLLLLFFSCGNDTIEIIKTSEERLQLIEQKFSELAASNQFHGGILVAKDGIPIFENAYGKDTEGSRNEITKPFNIASMGKMFTGVAIMQLVQNGQLGLDNSVYDYLPNYGKTEDAKKITIHHLLTHSSGIPDIFSYENIQKIDEDKIETWSDYFPYFEEEKLDFKPGKKFSYSNSGYLVLGAIIEAVMGQDYCSYLSENIFTPTEMNASSCGGPHGGSFLTMQEMLKFSEALQQYRLLDESNTELAMEDKVKIEKNVYYGYGFQVYKRYKSLEVSHKGGDRAIKGQTLMFTETGYTVIIYGNNNEVGYDGFNEARHYLREILT